MRVEIFLLIMSSFSEKFKESNTTVAVPTTTYPAPSERFTSHYSSVDAGVSSEGGVKDLSFKTIGYTEYAENLELMKESLFNDSESKPSIITDKHFDGQAKIDQLKQEIQSLKNQDPKYTKIVQETENISNNNGQLDVLLSSKQDLGGLGNQILQDYKDSTNNEIFINPQTYKQGVKNINDNVTQILDVQNLDETPYLSNQSTSLPSFVDPVADSMSSSFITTSDPSAFSQEIQMTD